MRARILIVTLASLLLASSAVAHPPGVADEDQAEELNYRVYGSNALIVSGKSALRHSIRQGTQHVRWIAVYVRLRNDWQLVASQETRVP